MRTSNSTSAVAQGAAEISFEPNDWTARPATAVATIEFYCELVRLARPVWDNASELGFQLSDKDYQAANAARSKLAFWLDSYTRSNVATVNTSPIVEFCGNDDPAKSDSQLLNELREAYWSAVTHISTSLRIVIMHLRDAGHEVTFDPWIVCTLEDAPPLNIFATCQTVADYSEENLARVRRWDPTASSKKQKQPVSPVATKSASSFAAATDEVPKEYCQDGRPCGPLEGNRTVLLRAILKRKSVRPEMLLKMHRKKKVFVREDVGSKFQVFFRSFAELHAAEDVHKKDTPEVGRK